jgi:XTP/dITP diphosphohydrolase
MISVILASSNAHKASEFKELFNDKILVQPAKEGIDVLENGSTYSENALLKAKAYYDKFKTPALADDSGLNVEAFPEILGLHSARFAPDLKTYQEKNLYLLELFEKNKIQDRRAYFTCVLCFYLAPGEIFFFEGRVHGSIGIELKGDAGFGYDPIFIPERTENDEKSLAELPEWKKSFSHRAKAAQAALQFFKESVDKTNK